MYVDVVRTTIWRCMGASEWDEMCLWTFSWMFWPSECSKITAVWPVTFPPSEDVEKPGSPKQLGPGCSFLNVQTHKTGLKSCLPHFPCTKAWWEKLWTLSKNNLETGLTTSCRIIDVSIAIHYYSLNTQQDVHISYFHLQIYWRAGDSTVWYIISEKVCINPTHSNSQLPTPPPPHPHPTTA